MTILRAIVERVTFQSPETGYSVLKCRAKGYNDLIPVIGNLADCTVGSVLLLNGSWRVDPKYGRQFQAESWEETLPATVYGMEKYLGSGLIKGVGTVYAKKIVQMFGADTFDVIESNPERLAEVPGIGKKRVEQIVSSWNRQKEIKNVMLFLQEHQVSTSYAARIFRTYGNSSIRIMKENPYRLADDIWGIGFKTADQIAGKLGFGLESFVRLRSGLMYTLSELSNDGHVFAEKEQLITRATELLGASEETVIMTLDEVGKTDRDSVANRPHSPGRGTVSDLGDSVGGYSMEPHDSASDSVRAEESGEGRGTDYRDKELIQEKYSQGTAVYLPPLYYAEIGVANKIKRLLSTPPSDRLFIKLQEARIRTGNPDLSVDVEKLNPNITYDSVQIDAIRLAATSKVMVLTGGPGTGKTTTTAGIIRMFERFGLKVLLAAPTGRAAKRMSESLLTSSTSARLPGGSGEAKTIHRLLEFKPPNGYQKNEEHPLEGDVLILDECSMIDIVLMNSLLKAVPSSMRLIMVGDIDQLPSVGAGNVLRDIIDSGVVPVVKLERIFRQAQESRIIMNAHRINRGEAPSLSNSRNSDFFFVDVENEEPEAVATRIVELVKTNLPKYYNVPPSSIQVLTPMQRGICGATNLNQELQAALNPANGSGELHRSGLTFRVNDKVMQIKNNYDKEVFNGDIGRVESIDLQDRTLVARFDEREVVYDVTELDELNLSYATTIHKAQGSEYPIVVMPILLSHYIMLQRNLLYTGITRAKKVLVLVGTRKAIGVAVRNGTVGERNSLLRERLSNC